MFTIYGRANSSNVRKVLWLCGEIGQTDYERHDYGRGYKPCSSPEYVALNPNMVVPTLVDGDLVLWESNTQLRYLASKFDRDDLYPKDIGKRAKVDMWLDWQLTTLVPGIRHMFQGLHVKAEGYTDPAGLEKAHRQSVKALEILDGQLSKTKHAAADSLTIADCSIGMFVHRWFALPIDRPELPEIAAYYERLKEREPFQEWIVGQGI